jgi:hypothetical protein
MMVRSGWRSAGSGGELQKILRSKQDLSGSIPAPGHQFVGRSAIPIRTLMGKSSERGDGALRSPNDFAHPQWRGAHALCASYLVVFSASMACIISSSRNNSASIRTYC